MLEGLLYLVFLLLLPLLLLVLFLILLFIFLFLLCASRLSTRQAKIDRPPGTAASLLMGTRARDGGGRQNRGKNRLTSQENECEKGKLRLRENRRTSLKRKRWALNDMHFRTPFAYEEIAFMPQVPC